MGEGVGVGGRSGVLWRRCTLVPVLSDKQPRSRPAIGWGGGKVVAARQRLTSFVRHGVAREKSEHVSVDVTGRL